MEVDYKPCWSKKKIYSMDLKYLQIYCFLHKSGFKIQLPWKTCLIKTFNKTTDL